VRSLALALAALAMTAPSGAGAGPRTDNGALGATLSGAFSYNYLGGAGRLEVFYRRLLFESSSFWVADSFVEAGVGEALASSSETYGYVRIQPVVAASLFLAAGYVHSLAAYPVGYIRVAGPDAPYDIYLPDGPKSEKFDADWLDGFRLRMTPELRIGGPIGRKGLLAFIYSVEMLFQDLSVGRFNPDPAGWYFDQNEFLVLRTRGWLFRQLPSFGYLSSGLMGTLGVSVQYMITHTAPASPTHQLLAVGAMWNVKHPRLERLGLEPFIRLRAGSWVRDPYRAGKLHVAGILGLTWIAYRFPRRPR
jgi:hypothetical protein